MKKLVTVLVALLLVAAACSDGDGGISVVTDAPADSDDGGSDDGGSGGGGSDDGGSGGGSDWCEFAQRVEDSNNALDFEATPEALEAGLTEFTDLLGEARGRAPGEIRGAVEEVADAFNAFVGEVEQVDYELFSLEFSVFDALDTPEVLGAGEAIEIYNERECGIPRDSDGGGFDDESPDLPEDGTIRDALVDGFVQVGFTQAEAECIAESATLEELTGAEDPAQLLAIFEACNIPLDRLAQLGG